MSLRSTARALQVVYLVAERAIESHQFGGELIELGHRTLELLLKLTRRTPMCKRIDNQDVKRTNQMLRQVMYLDTFLTNSSKYMMSDDRTEADSSMAVENHPAMIGKYVGCSPVALV